MAFTQQSLNYATEYSGSNGERLPLLVALFRFCTGSPNSATYKHVSGNAVKRVQKHDYEREPKRLTEIIFQELLQGISTPKSKF